MKFCPNAKLEPEAQLPTTPNAAGEAREHGHLPMVVGCPGKWWSHHPWRSQNHRMSGVGRDLCGSSSPTRLPKQGYLQQAAQDRIQVGLGYLQRRRIHSPSGQPVPVLRHPQREVLPHVPSCVSLCPLPLVLSLGTTEKSLAPSS